MTNKPIIEAHPALVIAHCISNSKLLMAVYDSGYRKGKGPYPFAANCIGGNPGRGEKNPLEVIKNEINEEYDPDRQGINHDKPNVFGQKVLWAAPGDIKLVRDSLIKGLKPYQDFLVNAQSWGEGTATYQAIYSYFQSNLSPDVIECAESNLRRQKTLSSEGLTGVFTLEELANDSRGELATAHATAHVLNYFFPGICLPTVKHLKVNSIGEPRDSFQDYLNDFQYSQERKPNHNNPEKQDPSFYDVLFRKQ